MKQHNQKWLAGKWWFIPTVATLAAVLLFSYVLIIGCVPSSSMEPTLPDGSFFLAVRVFRDLEEGDIIVFKHEGSMMVKRIVCVIRNEPEQKYYVLGDNSENSYDSRHWKNPYIEENDVIAKVLLGSKSN